MPNPRAGCEGLLLGLPLGFCVPGHWAAICIVSGRLLELTLPGLRHMIMQKLCSSLIWLWCHSQDSWATLSCAFICRSTPSFFGNSHVSLTVFLIFFEVDYWIC